MQMRGLFVGAMSPPFDDFALQAYIVGIHVLQIILINNIVCACLPIRVAILPGTFHQPGSLPTVVRHCPHS